MPLDQADLELIKGTLTARDQELMKKVGETIAAAITKQKEDDAESRRKADEEVEKATKKAQEEAEAEAAKKKSQEGKTPEQIKLEEAEAKIAKIEAERAEERTGAARSRLELQLSDAAKGKLAANAEKLILKEFMGLARMDDDLSFSFEIGGKPIADVSQALDRWLALPENKGYNKAPEGLNEARPGSFQRENFGLNQSETSLVSALSEIDGL